MNEFIDAVIGCDRYRCNMKLGSPCGHCGRSFSISEGLVIDSRSPELPSFLETIPYDEMHGVSVAGSRNLGVGYRRLIAEATGIQIDSNTKMLEIGSGTGLLSLGLYMLGLGSNLVVSDVSRAFLSRNRENMEKYALTLNGSAPPLPVHMLCSIDDLPFKRGSFDFAVGNSILHHIYDYRGALASLRETLRPGGWIVMSEPVVQGKILTAVILKLIAEVDKRSPQPKLSLDEYKQIEYLLIAAQKNWWTKVAEAKKDTADDKHLFDVKDLRALGSELGFSDVKITDVGSIETQLRAVVEGSAARLGINKGSLDDYMYLIDVFRNHLVSGMKGQFYCQHAMLMFKR